MEAAGKQPSTATEIDTITYTHTSCGITDVETGNFQRRVSISIDGKVKITECYVDCRTSRPMRGTTETTIAYLDEETIGELFGALCSLEDLDPENVLSTHGICDAIESINFKSKGLNVDRDKLRPHREKDLDFTDVLFRILDELDPDPEAQLFEDDVETSPVELAYSGEDQGDESWSVEDAAAAIVDALPEALMALKEHMDDFDGEILLHVFAGDAINIPMVNALKGEEAHHTPYAYASLVERLWRYGDDDVANVVDVTILEHLSDDEEAWQTFGTLISEEFRAYINEDPLTTNEMMRSVLPLKGN